MAYTSQITYPVYDLNSTEFLNILRSVLEVELLNQRATHGKTFLPQIVRGDDYLVDKVADKDIDPSFCSISKAKMEGSESNFPSQQNNLNYYIISIMANGLENLRKVADSIYVILNDLDVRTYLSMVKDYNGCKILFNKSTLKVSSLSTDFEVKKTENNRNVIYGNLILEAQIVEKTKLNTSTPINSIEVNTEFGDDKKEIIQLTEFN